MKYSETAKQMLLSNGIFEETTNVLKNGYLKHKHEFDEKRKKLTERNNKAYPDFIKKQNELIKDRKM